MERLVRNRSISREPGVLKDISNCIPTKRSPKKDASKSDILGTYTTSCPELPGFSKKKSLPVLNIDRDDGEDPQRVTDYVDSIYAYLRCLEKSYYEPLQEPPGSSSEKMVTMRSTLVDWLVEVHEFYSLLQETLYLTVNILDRFLHLQAGDIRRDEMQLIGVTAMLIASKYEEMYAASVHDFVYITNYSYDAPQIRDMEIRILRTLKFDVSPPLALNFLRRFSKAGLVQDRVHILAKYILELSLMDHELSTRQAPSLLAAGALGYSMMVRDNTKILHDLWNPTLAHYTGYSTDEVREIVRKLNAMTIRISQDKPSKAVVKKYSLASRASVANLSGLKKKIVGL